MATSLYPALDLSQAPFDYFKKRAKDLQQLIQDGDPAAKARASAVLKDDERGLMRLQHVVAVEHGFTNWEALRSSDPLELHLAITLAKIPDLNDFGIGVFYNFARTHTAEEIQERHLHDRGVLRRTPSSRIAEVLAWLEDNVPLSSGKPAASSYVVKHIAEHGIGYLTNGLFIAAAVMAGYPYTLEPGRPNVLFGMDKQGLGDIPREEGLSSRLCRSWTALAVEILRRRGVRVRLPSRYGAEGDSLAWTESDGIVRTLKIGRISGSSTPVVRLFVDYFTLFDRRTLKMIEPRCPKGEISLLPKEVPAALEWALGVTVRSKADVLPLPPFEMAPEGRFNDSRHHPAHWSYLWSKRAVEAEFRHLRRLPCLARHASRE